MTYEIMINITITQIRLEHFRKILLYSLPFEWNNLGDLVYQNNKVLFKTLLREKLFEEITEKLGCPCVLSRLSIHNN
jgi:hypothetical protein